MSSFVVRARDAGHSLRTAAAATARGCWLTACRGATGAAVGSRGLVSRRPGSAAVLAIGVARLLLQLPADALLMLLPRLLSALQTLAGLEAPARLLDDDERALLARVFGDAIDPRRVRLKVGRLGLLALPRRAFVVGDTVQVPVPHNPAAPGSSAAPPSLARRAPALLVHELTHVWQHQSHGTRYLSECLLAQWLGEGYNVAVPLAAGRGWAGLNFEQQAELLERAFAAGWFDDGGDDGASRLLMRLDDARRDDGFTVALAPESTAAAMLAQGWCDATPMLRDGLAAIRGAPTATASRGQC